MSRFSRTEKLIGQDAQRFLKERSVLIVGIGGVGGYVFETLVRAGIGSFTIVDGDKVDISNLNRQIISLDSNVGQDKVEAAKQRAESINPEVKIRALNINYNGQTKSLIFDRPYDYCVDCFDSVRDKIDFIKTAYDFSYPLISATGAGNRTDPDFMVCDIYKTAYDPLAKAVRTGLKGSGVKKLKVVCDAKPPLKISGTPASISYAPALMGCYIGAEVIKDLLKI